MCVCVCVCTSKTHIEVCVCVYKSNSHRSVCVCTCTSKTHIEVGVGTALGVPYVGVTSLMGLFTPEVRRSTDLGVGVSIVGGLGCSTSGRCSGSACPGSS